MMKTMKPEKKRKWKNVLTFIFNVIIIFIAVQLSYFIAEKFSVRFYGIRKVAITFVCTFGIYCVATLIVERLIPAIREKLAKAEKMAQDSDKER
jgi:integral membrane sensor domain MASE1